MSHADALQQFKEGLDLLRNHCPEAASVRFKHAVEMDSANPFYLSYLGLALARTGGRLNDAEKICYDALRKQANLAELYLNLAEVYGLSRKREDEIDTLIVGLRFTRQDPRLSEALEKLGRRRPPVLSFLDRRNLINVGLGKIRHQLSGRPSN
jgi:predicted Zn-dependent protease